jgi:hypothetical protein
MLHMEDSRNMSTEALVSAIDEELARLKQVRNLLAGGGGENIPSQFQTHKKLGRPAKKKRVLSAEAREKIAAAQRKRWAAQKKAAK